ncbi:hypothetical protein HanRHA438_Chr09g0376571 [Helianthus annuus]|uniref:Uncharacterized protein n=1 Tax=Helianthus annuus TaxID=4232 RepID=A0A9K3I2U0_HELAN|nr:hypothetical protein HanXRQr2_Chr09g0365041 [Helianthus annuus]KAJ0886192.1 hypothetical protein HanRHA438_Chr09g0376571 [Helianthus annuus]
MAKAADSRAPPSDRGGGATIRHQLTGTMVKVTGLVPPPSARDGGVKTRAATTSVSLYHFLSLDGHLVICLWFGV